MSEMKKYEVATVAQNPETYRKYTEAWWKWVYDGNRDANPNRGEVTFMRGNIVGPPDKPDDNIKEIHGKEGTDIFFPVYQIHICEVDKHPKGGVCDTPEKQQEVANADLDKVQDKWATISIDGAKAVPITENLNDHEVPFVSFELDVPDDDNDLKREPEYHLKKGKYKGVARGTFILLKNFKVGTYVLDFGGKASNYRTRSEYTLHITK